MRKLKKLASVMLALVMVCAMNVTVFADDTTYTISLAADSEGYTYAVYQIFTGDVSGETLSNVEWGSSMTDDAKAALEAEYSVSGAAAVAEAIAAANDAQAVADALADYIDGMTAVGTLSDDNTSLTVAGGYYLIVNTVVPEGDYGYSDFIVEVVGDTTINPKNDSTPTFDKTVGTDADGDLANTDDATEDYAIGDSVPFTLTATLASSYSAYDTYKLVFNDTLSSGLTYDEGTLTVTVDGTALDAADYTLVVDGQNITVTINDLKTVAPDAVAGSTVVVSYTATLNENAGSIEYNDASLTYSNNPNDDGTGSTGTTPDDKTYVITFTLTVDKTDEEANALAGAAFQLYTKDDDGGYTVLVKEFEAGDATSFAFNGLSIGDYMLVESVTPDGYNTIDPIYFTITAEATEDATAEDGVTVTSSASVTGGDAEITASSTALSTTVVNKAGSSLPSTGGIGTTIFYIVGCVLVLGAVILLITRKRMSRSR